MPRQSLEEAIGLSRPMNVEQIVQKAQNYDYNPLVPLKYWFRTAGTLLKEAEIYEHEGNDQQTYLLLFRHAQLVLKHLSIHPDVRQPENRLVLQQAEKEVQHGLAKLEVLRPRINKRYERYEQLVRDRDDRRKTASSRTPAMVTGPEKQGTSQQHQRNLSDPAIAGTSDTLAAEENKDLAVILARKEIKRRAIARKATRQAGIPEEVEQERRTAGLWGNWEEAFTKDDTSIDQDTLSRQMQNIRLQVNASERNGVQNGNSRPSFESSHSSYNYPTIPSKGANGQKTLPTSTDHSQHPASTSLYEPPTPPPKDAIPPPPAPPRPEKPHISATPPAPDSPVPSTPQPSLKPSTFTFQPSAYLESGVPLRTIFLPPTLRSTFLTLAQSNTRSNLETCGMLCGTLISNALFVSKLVVPEQESTSDTCEMLNEAALFDYVDGEDLMVLGWIHTHPTQTCFMSSRDLHTHAGYQMMMAESVAIVCAPSKGDWGVFRLTDPPGMKSVLNCTQLGLFHPHVESNIYTDALRPGHVHELKGLEFELVDLRPGGK